MNCRQFRIQVINLLDGECPLPDEEALKAHAETCPECAREFDELKQTLEALQPSRRVSASPELKEIVMSRIVTLSNETPRPTALRRPWKPVVVLCCAVALISAALVALSTRPSAAVYALEQTIEANRGLRSIHMRMSPTPLGSAGEIWAQFDDKGELLSLRMDFPDTEDGPKEVIWADGKAEIWFKAKGSTVVVREEDFLERLGYEMFDPRVTIEELRRKAAAKGASAEVREPLAAGAPITVTIAGVGTPQRRDVIAVDPKSKRMLRHDVYDVRDGAESLTGSTEYLDYNQPIDPAVFELDLPQDTTRVDQTTQAVGLVQGKMSDEDVAAEVVRQFFEALIAKDYGRAGQLMEGLPAARMEESFGRMDFVRIVAIDAPVPHEPTRSLKVPCKIEVASGGETTVFEPKGPFVRQVHNQPGRWTIIGGI